MEENNLLNQLSALWEKGANCAQSTATGLLYHYIYEEAGQILFDSLYPYGGGFHEGGICGAITGTLAGLSFLIVKAGMDKEKITIYSNLFKEEFLKEFPSLRCHELMDPFKNSNGEINWKLEKRRETCTKAVESAALIANSIIYKLLKSEKK
jgi:C_GCAxxG_C_C family probable redox protein